jgi:hypothetical protein
MPKKTKIEIPLANCERINLHGFDIEIYKDAVHIFMNDSVAEYDYKTTANRLMTYLICEAFIPKENIKVEIKVVEPIEEKI